METSHFAPSTATWRVSRFEYMPFLHHLFLATMSKYDVIHKT